MKEYKMYRADYVDENFEIIVADNDIEAIDEAWQYEEKYGIILNLYEIDEEYNEIKSIF